MKPFTFGVVIIAAICAAFVFGAEEPAKDKEEEVTKTYRRLIPADVLRGESEVQQSIFMLYVVQAMEI